MAFLWCILCKHCGLNTKLSLQLTNWILWNGHFYHIEVIDLPFHRITFVSWFISLIVIIFVVQSLLGSLFLALRTWCAAMCAAKSCEHVQWQWKTLIKSRLRFNCSHPMVILIHWPSSNFTVSCAALCATHIGTCALCKRTRNAWEAMK